MVSICRQVQALAASNPAVQMYNSLPPSVREVSSQAMALLSTFMPPFAALTAPFSVTVALQETGCQLPRRELERMRRSAVLAGSVCAAIAVSAGGVSAAVFAGGLVADFTAIGLPLGLSANTVAAIGAAVAVALSCWAVVYAFEVILLTALLDDGDLIGRMPQLLGPLNAVLAAVSRATGIPIPPLVLDGLGAPAPAGNHPPAPAGVGMPLALVVGGVLLVLS
jgi:hypothetical protein